LAPGLVVRVRGTVGVWEGGSKLRFSMDLLDVEALVGNIAAARRRLLKALAAEDLLEANRRLPLPTVPLRLGLVTSEGGEAHRDFTGQIERSHYAFEVCFESSLVQGPAAAAQLSAAIRRLQDLELDLIVLVRGGGARGDLAAFDSEEVARAIATSRCPVWTGIGHTGDRSVADDVAQRALVTPTACGKAVVEAVDLFLDGLDRRRARLCVHGRREPEAAAARLAGSARHVVLCSRHQLDRSVGALDRSGARVERAAVVLSERLASELRRSAQRLEQGAKLTAEQMTSRLRRDAGGLVSACRRTLSDSATALEHRHGLLEVYDPQRQLARGWSLTRGPGGRILRSVTETTAGEELTTVLADGDITSTVKAARPSPDATAAAEAAALREDGS
ncbi:MAG: exodeoxyribonuclease VII large subunit, partial [Acidimicrobiales bacterium]